MHKRFKRNERTTERPKVPMYEIAIGVPEMSARHSGANIAAQVLEVIDEHGIRDKIDDIGKNLGFDGRRRRGRCFGHILNLSAKALMFGKSVHAFEKRLRGEAMLTETEYELWQKRGPVGKIHIIVTEIHRSDRLTYMLRDLQLDDINKASGPKIRARKPLSVIVDNDTRWLSQLYMIRRALQLRPGRSQNAPSLAGSHWQCHICRPELEVTSSDWDVLEHMVTILGHYENTVKTLEGDGITRKRKKGYCGSYGNIWDVIHGFEYLLEILEYYKSVAGDFSEPEHFKVGINMAWEKLEKYYSKLNETPIYYAALAFHSAYRWNWFMDHWAERAEWIEEAKGMVQEVRVNSYSDLDIVRSTDKDGPVVKRQKRYYNAFEDHCFKARQKPTANSGIMGPFNDEVILDNTTSIN
ncbi:restless-like transposase [Metarhizium robertsii ARSEF 23]|uniref:Restless-like transposase n=1 Tax=Metarhizium robertsii (strain ARSEF 23 / ATCC MYA-3075) TaxID=655844 RepID=E9EK87_METRA|nr:restless-like transposase [Metarhizium robertsii ARSEF 23]EFZ03427.2 restless-like transposase [Metarhizium robertsii ARSEF 23]